MYTDFASLPPEYTPVPSSFDPLAATLSAIPRHTDWVWSYAERVLTDFKSTGVLMRTPLFWQMELPLFSACRVAGAPIFINDQDNMPIGASAIRTACMDTVVTDASDALRFSTYLKEHDAQMPRSWLIAHQITNSSWDAPLILRNKETHVAQEVYLFPGVPILQQCTEHIAAQSSVFHAAHPYDIHEQDGGLYISSKNDEAVSLTEYKLPDTCTLGEHCSCGERTILAR